jgi:hypothetical protein
MSMLKGPTEPRLTHCPASGAQRPATTASRIPAGKKEDLKLMKNPLQKSHLLIHGPGAGFLDPAPGILP